MIRKSPLGSFTRVNCLVLFIQGSIQRRSTYGEIWSWIGVRMIFSSVLVCAFVMPSRLALPCLLICIPNRECSQIGVKKKKKTSLAYALLTTAYLTFPPPLLPFWLILKSQRESSLATPTPPLSFVFSLPLIVELAPKQWAGQDSMSEWKRQRKEGSKWGGRGGGRMLLCCQTCL